MDKLVLGVAALALSAGAACGQPGRASGPGSSSKRRAISRGQAASYISHADL